MSTTPTVIGRYQVLNRIGQGGMGSLYLAWDPMLERQIAIKLLRDDNEELRERFSREARSVARLRHPNIVTIFDVGEQDGQPFIAMEYIHGQTLGDLIRGTAPIPVVRKLQMMDELCDGLGFAHRAGIVHRDIKPANVMVEQDGLVRILDFGIARVAESGMTQAGMLIGTLNYMSPEQVAGQVVDRRSDIFAVGAVFYELLTLRQAFPGGLQHGILHRILHEPPPPAASLCHGLDPEILRIVDRALEKDPRARYQDLQGMRKDLQRVQQRLASAAIPEPSSETVVIDPADIPPSRPPTPRRGTDREDLARRRAEQIATHVDTAGRALAAQEFDKALAEAEQALLIDPEESRALEIVERARVALDERQAQDLIAQGRAKLAAGSHTEAWDLARQALTLLPGSSAALQLRDAVDAARADAIRARERADRLGALIERGRARFNDGTFDEARATAEEALAIDPDNDDARQLRQRAIAAVEQRRREEADRRVAETIAGARRAFEAGRQADALRLLDAFEPSDSRIAEAAAALRVEAEAIRREERETRERMARDERVAAALAKAAASTGAEAIVVLDEALRRDPDSRDLREEVDRRRTAKARDEEAARRRREIALAAEQEAERLERARQERVAAAATKAERTADHDRALAILDAALAVDSGDPVLTAARDRRKEDARKAREEEAARETARAAAEQARRATREREEHISAAIRAARAARSHQAALDALAPALALDPAHPEARRLFEARTAALESERAEASRLKALDQIRDAAGSLIAEGRFDVAEGTIDRAETELHAKRELKDLRRQLREARQRAEQARPTSPTPDVSASSAGSNRPGANRLVAGGAAAAVLVAVVGGYLLMHRSPAPHVAPNPSPPTTSATSSAAPPTPRPHTTAPSGNTGRGSPAPVSPPASPPTTQTGDAGTLNPPPPTPTESAAADGTRTRTTEEEAARAREAKIGEDVSLGRQQLRNGNARGALATSAAGLTLDSANRDLRALQADIVTAARRDSTAARRAAEARGDRAKSSDTFQKAAGWEAEAARRERLGRRDVAAELLWRAADAFREAAAAVPAAPPPTESKNLPPPPSAPRTVPPSAAAAGTGASGASTAPANPSSSSAAPAPKPARPPLTDDEAIRATLNEYETAYRALDVAGVQRVYPSIPVDHLARVFRDLSAQDVQIEGEQIAVNGANATVMCQVRQSFTPKVGAGGSSTRKAVFRLQKANGRWIILERQ